MKWIKASEKLPKENSIIREIKSKKLIESGADIENIGENGVTIFTTYFEDKHLIPLDGLEWLDENQDYLEWTKEDSQEASKQGWNIFDADGKTQLQREDEMGIFPGDAEALESVIFKASLKDSKLARKALAILMLENPLEFRDFWET